MTTQTDVLRQISPREAIERWDIYEPQVAHVLRETDGGLDAEDVLTNIQFGSMQLWDVLQGRAVCVTELQAYPRYSQLLVYLVAGADAGDWIAQGDQQLTSFAKLKNCKYVIFQGRPGWERYCGRLGYRDKLIMMRKGV